MQIDVNGQALPAASDDWRKISIDAVALAKFLVQFCAQPCNSLFIELNVI